jgi:ubiquinone/menaquinone biosynthesis C-methylase UbiE
MGWFWASKYQADCIMIVMDNNRNSCNPGGSIKRLGSLEPVCNVCHSEISEIGHKKLRVECLKCGKVFKEVAGFLDFRIRSDRYLSLNQERQKAERLSHYENQESLEQLTRRYYQITADVSTGRRERFVRHVLDAELRGAALLKRIPEKATILELGTGTGGFMGAALKAGRNAVGVDIASRWLVVARKRLAEMGFHSSATLYPACAEKLPWPDNTFDSVVADSLLEHLEKPESAFKEMFRVTKPGGTILIWSPNRYWPGVDPHVGLFGVGYLNRSWAKKYVQWRRGDIHWPLSRSPKVWSKMALEVINSSEVQYQAADFSGWPITDKSIRARIARLLGRMTKTPFMSIIMTQIGPVGEIRIVKPVMDLDSHHMNQVEVF